MIRIACSAGLPLVASGVWLLWGFTGVAWFCGVLFVAGATYTCPVWDFWEENSEPEGR